MELEEVHVQINNEVPSVREILRPMVYISWILGVGIARPENFPKIVTIIFRIFHFGVCSVIVAYGAIDFFTFGNVFKSDIFKIMYYMNKVVSYVASYYYVIHGLIQYEKWPELMKKTEKLDQRIRQDISIDDRVIKTSQILAIVATFMLGPVSLVIHALYYYYTQPDDIFASDLLLYYTIAQSSMNSFFFDIIVYVVCRRFKTINGIIENLDRKFDTNWTALKIRRIRELHDDISDLVSLLNDIHGVHLLLCSANSFMMVVATLFRIYMGVVEKNYKFMVINNIIWMIYAGHFAITCWICTSACQESNRTGALIHTTFLKDKENAPILTIDKLLPLAYTGPCDEALSWMQNHGNELDRLNNKSRATRDYLHTCFEKDRIRNEVNDFSVQLLQRKIAFTACEFFEMNNSLLSGFVGVITTYLIILVQFYRPENYDDVRCSRELNTNIE